MVVETDGPMAPGNLSLVRLTRAVVLGALLVGAPLMRAHAAMPRPAMQASGADVRLRGISAVDGRVAWASGQKGTVLRTVDGGTHWTRLVVPDAQALDFRDIEAFDADTAVILAIGPGEASRIYRTVDGGATWTPVLQNRDPRAFFDCMTFDGARGWMLGDPVDGRFQLYATTDGGRRWRLTGDGPEAAEGDAAFAASGPCIAQGHGRLAVATGGPEPSLQIRRDGEPDWERLAMRMTGVAASTGVFSVAPTGTTGAFVAVGGDYKAESTPAASATTSTVPVLGHRRVGKAVGPDAFGHALAPLPMTSGYRSGVACRRGEDACLAVGPTGVDQLRDGMWVPVSAEGFDAISIAGNVAWMVGNGGRIARMVLED